MGKQVKFFDKNAWWFIVVINILFLLGIIFIASFVSASSFGYNDIPQGFKTITQNINTTQIIVNGTAVNASSFSTACSGTNKVSNVTYSNFSGLFTIVCTTDETSAGGEPLWSANYTLFNSTWSSIFNSTYNDAWKYVTNNSFYPYTSNPFGYLNTSTETNWNANYSTFLTHINWGQATNGTLMLASNWNATNTSYYLITNPFSFYNLTSWNNPYSYWNLTFATFNKSYADTLYQPIGTYIDQTYGNVTYYLKTNPFSFYNSTNFPYTSLSNFTNNMGFYNITSWNNPYTYFNLTNFPNYANVYLNTTNQFSYYNLTTLSAYLNTSNQYGYINLTTLSGNETDPKWSGNLSNFSSVYNFVSNATFYLKNNPFNFYNSTTLSAYLNTSNQFGYINITTLAGNETDPKAYNTTLAYNTSLSGYRQITNNTFVGNVNINSAGNLNITSGNSTIFLGRIKLGIDTQNCAGMVSGEICRNNTAVYIKG